jgi:hypothetical protein
MKEESTEEALQSYLDRLQVDDLLQAASAARKKGMARLEDQGIAALALFISELLAEALERVEPPTS